MLVTFGGLIADARKTRGHTQDAFARQVGVSRNYVSQIERNEAPSLTIRLLDRLACETGIDVHTLLDTYRQQYQARARLLAGTTAQAQQ